jgi:hypothetical protein
MKHKLKLFSRYKAIVCCTLILGVFSFPGIASASLINSDFSGGFNNWEGFVDIVDEFGSPLGFLDPIDPSAYSNNFMLSGDTLTLMGSEEDNNGTTELFYLVGIYQNFTLSALAPGVQSFLSIDVTASLFDSDAYQVALFDANTFSLLADLSSGGRFDVSAWAGRDVYLEFTLIDNEGAMDSSLAVSNISLEQVTAQVSEPATFSVFALAIMLFIRRLQKNAI